MQPGGKARLFCPVHAARAARPARRHPARQRADTEAELPLIE